MKKLYSPVSAITKLLEQVQRTSNNNGYKRRGVCYICQDPGHYAPECPTKKDSENPGNKNPGQQIRYNNACFHCGEIGHSVAQCLMKNMPELDQVFEEDMQDFQEPPQKKKKTTEPKKESKKNKKENKRLM